ncbi:MAG: signal peptidase I [Candidatus Paceibacterota bacterium]
MWNLGDDKKFAIVAFVIVWPIRAFVAQPFIVLFFNGSNFLLKIHNILWSTKYHTDLKNQKRGDVVVFKYPTTLLNSLIKRIIGLPGETISIDGSKVSIETKDGEKIDSDEPYVKNESSNNLKITTSETEYFVMGDNRSRKFRF